MIRYGSQDRPQTRKPERVPCRPLQGPAALCSSSESGGRKNSTRSAFTLIELLVVISIIGILAAIGLPAMRGFGKSNALTSAMGQLLDDVTLARQRAISGHTDVYMVFIPPGIVNYPNLATLNNNDKKLFLNLAAGQYTSYALFSFRSVGEQPGQSNPRYLTSWRTLPEGLFIATNKFIQLNFANWQKVVPDYNRPFRYLPVPFPTATNNYFSLPAIVFDYQGRLVTRDDQRRTVAARDEIIPLARGSIFYDRDASGNLVLGPADVKETPPGNSVTSSNLIHIEWLTGRARVETQQIQ